MATRIETKPKATKAIKATVPAIWPPQPTETVVGVELLDGFEDSGALLGSEADVLEAGADSEETGLGEDESGCEELLGPGTTASFHLALMTVSALMSISAPTA